MRQLWADIAEGLRAHMLRSLMIVGAVALGAFALTVLLAVAHGLARRTDALVRQLGEHTFVVLGGTSPPAGPGLRLQAGMAGLLQSDLQDLDVSVTRSETADVPDYPDRVQVTATDNRLASVRGWRITAGRFLDESDVARAQHEIVITQSLSDRWNLHVGNEITLGRTPFDIVGIVQTPQSSLEAEVLARDIAVPDFTVFVPYTVEPDWITGTFAPPSGVDAIYVRAQDESPLAELAAKVSNLLSQTGMDAGQMKWVTPASLSLGLNRLKNMVTATAGGVAVLALVLGGITLVSLMVANVRDRVVEIGLRRAFGARTRDIVALFVVEALAITCGASLLGILAASAVLLTAGPWPVPASLSGFAVCAPLAFGMLLGALSAWWPARLAARIQPALALRSI